jgi:phospholipid-transporting ATPase
MIEANGLQEEYQVLNILEFNSTRKRMSSIIRAPNGRIILYCKGADTVILERCAPHQPYKESTLIHLEEYATEGLRTLCIAMREIPEEEYQPWAAIYERAAATVNGRTEEIDKASELIEKNLFLLGATAIEDKLQEGVPDTIYTLQQAGIKVWVLTGDRQETAINIGLSCRLISESMNLVIVNEESADATADFIHKRLLALRAASKNPADSEDLALIIGLFLLPPSFITGFRNSHFVFVLFVADGKSLGFALDKSISKPFLELAVLCKAVVCCKLGTSDWFYFFFLYLK